MKTAVLGATGLVGRTMLKLLEECPWLTGDPLPLASARSAGVRLGFAGRELTVREVGPDSFDGIEVALFSAGGDASRRWGPVAVAAGAWVVDNSSAFRLEPDVPLVVPEINGRLAVALATGGRRGGILANPNCSTIQIAAAAAPLDDAFGLREVHVTTLQAVSGAGQSAVRELLAQGMREGDPAAAGEIFPRAIAATVIPEIGPALPDGSFEEETKVIRELRKILGRGEDLAVTCTAVRVPVLAGHSAAIRFVCQRKADPAAAAEALRGLPGLLVADDPHEYITPREGDGRRTVHVGRLRQDPQNDHALLCWVVADNLLKGAAWNAVQIADLLAAGAGA